jgi:hypothetical protein
MYLTGLSNSGARGRVEMRMRNEELEMRKGIQNVEY